MRHNMSGYHHEIISKVALGGNRREVAAQGAWGALSSVDGSASCCCPFNTYCRWLTANRRQ